MSNSIRLNWNVLTYTQADQIVRFYIDLKVKFTFSSSKVDQNGEQMLQVLFVS